MYVMLHDREIDRHQRTEQNTRQMFLLLGEIL